MTRTEVAQFLSIQQLKSYAQYLDYFIHSYL